MRKKTKNRYGGFGLQVLMLLFLLLVGANGAYAQSDCFVYEKNDNTVIKDLTDKGRAASSLTIPSTVTTVRSGAFTDASSLTDLVIEEGGNPKFEGKLYTEITCPVKILNMGTSMTEENMKSLLSSISDATLTDVIIEGFAGTTTGFMEIDWSNTILNSLGSDAKVTLSAELVGDQEFGSAQVFGRFYINKELISFCTSATFLDQSGSNMLFYVADSREADGRLHIQRVRYIAAGQGVLIHKTKDSSGYADLERTQSFEDAVDEEIEQAITDKALYDKNMLVGVTTATQIGKTNGNGDKTNYVLKDGAFHPTSGGTIKANRAYLQLPASATAHDGTLDISFDEETTGIRTTNFMNSKNSDTWFDLQGRYVGRAEADSSPLTSHPSPLTSHPSPNKGLYINNGKKYVVR